MSGIVGIFRRDGAPVERSLLRSLTHFLSYRGPDAREVWSDGPVGFGHTMLRTTDESSNERQPASLDGRFCITADARLDDRAELETKLDRAERRVRRNAPDAELILHAYAAWGEECVRHLRGDFAFAIWDARRRSLFCARDHFGVKPFYYSDLADLFLFSNTLDCVRIHPEVSDDFNEAAIADFLLFGLNYDVASTTFGDVRRLPPAHFLTVSPEVLRIERYWSAPTDGRIRYHRDDDYIEHFQVLLRAAVADRLRTDRAAVFLSGGLDSSSVAATARELAARSSAPVDLCAFTVTYESLFADSDGEHARQAAQFLGMPIRCLPMDGLQPFERWDDPKLSCPEPVDDPFLAGLFDQFGAIATDYRVVLSGEGIDNLMHFQMWPYVQDLCRNRDWRRLLTDVPRYLWLRPFPWKGIRHRVGRLFAGSGGPGVPRWIAPDFARRMNLEERWRDCGSVCPSAGHPLLPKAHASLSLPQWSRMFELEDSGLTRCPVEVRYPFLDLRIVNYVLALPPFPWAFEKKLLREAMGGRLPESVRLRPKTPWTGDTLTGTLQRATESFDKVRWCEDFERYVDLSALPEAFAEKDPERAGGAIRPLCFNFWLQSARRIGYNLMAEVRNG
jgi:asparagine synthase (glutamine-hydrolysing)